MGVVGMGERVEGWRVRVRSDGDLFGAGVLLLGDGWLQIEAPRVDRAKLVAARKVRLALLAAAVVLIVLAVQGGGYSAPFLLAAAVAAIAAGLYGSPRWWTSGTCSERWMLEDLGDVKMADASENLILGVLLFGILGFLLGSLLPRRWLQFAVSDPEWGEIGYMIDLGSLQQFFEVAGKLHSLERPDAADLG
jgi:hypothetical protein